MNFDALYESSEPKIDKAAKAANDKAFSDNLKRMVSIVALLCSATALLFIYGQLTNSDDYLSPLVRTVYAIVSVVLVIIVIITSLIAAKARMQESEEILVPAQGMSSENIQRLESFCADNDLIVRTNLPGKLDYPGVYFQAGPNGFSEAWVSARDSSYVVGRYQYSFNSINSAPVAGIDASYMMIQLPRVLPHFVLDSKANNLVVFGKDILSDLPRFFDKDQIIELEGDFNKYFTLYGPKKYETDARYIFTPDLMALLIDNIGKLEVEIVDDKLFIYSRTLNIMKPETWDRLMSIKDIIGKKMIRQTDYYADARIGDRKQNVVTKGAQRINSNMVAAYTIVGVVLIGIMIAIVILDSQ